MDLLKRLVMEEEGQGLVEYALIIALVAIIAMVGLQLLGPEIDKILIKSQQY